MNFKNLLMTFAAAATLASAATYQVRLNEPSVVDGHEFKPGVYRIDVDTNQQVRLHDGQRLFFAALRPTYDKGKTGTELRFGKTKWTLVTPEKREKSTNSD